MAPNSGGQLAERGAPPATDSNAAVLGALSNEARAWGALLSSIAPIAVAQADHR